uniref:Uncharacterized protein n=1 Tax=Tetranychus urticae TaxID=32264 RepID=T1KHJ8_TETUR
MDLASLAQKFSANFKRLKNYP